MKKVSLIAAMAVVAMLSGCASCCAPMEVTYVDKPIMECTRAVQKIE